MSKEPSDAEYESPMAAELDEPFDATKESCRSVLLPLRKDIEWVFYCVCAIESDATLIVKRMIYSKTG
jgi:hypothetical protein